MSGPNSYWGYFKTSSLFRVTSAEQRKVAASLQPLVLHCVCTHSGAGELVRLGQVTVITAHRTVLLAVLVGLFFFLSSPFSEILYSGLSCSCVVPAVCSCAHWGDNSGAQG